VAGFTTQYTDSLPPGYCPNVVEMLVLSNRSDLSRIAKKRTYIFPSQLVGDYPGCDGIYLLKSVMADAEIDAYNSDSDLQDPATSEPRFKRARQWAGRRWVALGCGGQCFKPYYCRHRLAKLGLPAHYYANCCLPHCFATVELYGRACSEKRIKTYTPKSAVA